MALSRRIQHILNKNPVPSGRVIHQHMGHGATWLLRKELTVGPPV